MQTEEVLQDASKHPKAATVPGVLCAKHTCVAVTVTGASLAVDASQVNL